MNDAEGIIKIIEDHIADATESLERCPAGHPLENNKIVYLRALNNLKADLIRSDYV
jgi:hypothetical protein